MKPRTPGQLIVIDGIDQSGKKTQTGLLARKIRRQGFSCVIWSFPVYQTILGRRLKAYLTGKERPDLHVVHLLYAANKWEVAGKINEQRASGVVVIANRYTPSNLAYGAAHDLPLNWLTTLEADLPKPSRIFILDVPVKTSFGRKIQQRDIHEEDAAYLDRVRRTYLRLAKQYNWTVVNGESEPTVVHSKIWNSTAKSLGRK
ncbi:MAG TPA: dTMP kinase [Methylomirabilota bacterium]|nr:dTMP kinase [Methylomirabilota bacterium]